MSTLGEVFGSLRADSPWLLLVAGVLFAGASAAWKRATGSLQRIGARVGQLEQDVTSERTRRRQVEAELLRIGIGLPYWPDDPAVLRELALRRHDGRGRRHDGRDHEDQGDEHDQPVTRHAPAVPPPPGRANRHADSR